jgi:hypothetical protein
MGNARQGVWGWCPGGGGSMANWQVNTYDRFPAPTRIAPSLDARPGSAALGVEFVITFQ